MTEYMLTADIAREFMERSYPVKVEAKNRDLVNAMTARKGTNAALTLRSKRTDIAIADYNGLLALVELKIGVKKLRGIKLDLDKITTTINLLKARHAAKAIGAVVFQVHIPGTRSRSLRHHFQQVVDKVENALESELIKYAETRPGFTFKIHPLQDPTEGIVERELEIDGEEMAWGQEGHATRYHAILIRSTRPVPPTFGTFEDLKREREE
jgi:phage-related tail protein